MIPQNVNAFRRSPYLANNLVLLLVLIAGVLIISLFVPYYLSLSNLLDATRSGGEIGLMGIGMTAVLLIGGIDLSVGSIFALSAIVVGILIQSGFGVLPAALFGIATGVVAGALNGIIITRLRIPPIIVTLATMAVYRGITIGLSKGASYPVPESFYFLGQGSILGLPTQLIILIAGAVIVTFILRRTTLGTRLFAIGISEEAARFSAIKVRALTTLVYGFSGLMASIASLVYMSRVVSAKANFGMGYELDAITIAVLGGAELKGGKANVVGTVMGMLIVELLRRGLTMGFVQSEVQSIFIGIILIMAVAANNVLGTAGWRGLGGRKAHVSRDDSDANSTLPSMTD